VIAELRGILAGDCGLDAEAVRRAVEFAPEDPAWPVIVPRLVERFATEMRPVIALGTHHEYGPARKLTKYKLTAT
jgi:hypothetical protein